jgi:tetratricopeptide (TPR) repeat protein
MDHALAQDPGSIPALYGAITACVETGGAASSDPSRYLPMLRARMRERTARRDWRLAWLEGRVLLAQGDASGAVRAIERAERLGGAGWADLVIDKVAALARGGRAADAAHLREQEIARIGEGPDGARAAAQFAFRAGRAFAAIGEGDQARAAYADAESLDRSNPNYAVAYAWSLVTGARFEEAVSAASSGLARFPGDPYLLGTRGWALFQVGRLAEAERDLRAALDALPPEDRQARAAEAAHLGEVLLRRGAVEEAHTFLHRALAEPEAAGLGEVQRARALLDSLDRS